MEDSHKEGSPALDAKTMIAPPSPRTPRTPRTPRFQRPALAFNRTLSLDPSVQGSRRSSAASQAPPRVLLLQEPPDYEQSLSAPSVCLKMAQFGLAVLCLGLVSDGYLLVVSQNVTAMHFPFIVFSSYTIITGVILFGYAMGMKMRELLMRIFGAMGALLFLISAIHTANRATVFWEHWAGMYEEGPSEESLFDPDTVPRRRVCFVLQTALSFVAAALYAADVAHSYRRTLLLLQIPQRGCCGEINKSPHYPRERSSSQQYVVEVKKKMTHEEPDRNSEDHCKYPTNNESSPPTSPIQKLTKTFSQDTTSSDAAWHAGGGGLLTPCTHREDPPAHFEARLCNAGFALKIAQWSLCILCTGLFFEGSSLIYDFKNQLFPYIVYWTYMMITGVIILSYLLGQKMREMLIRVYNIIGAIMFFIASIIIFSITVAEWGNWNNEYTNSSTFVENSIPKSSKTDIPTKPKLAKMLLTQSVLCLLNSFVYLLDIAYSLYTSYNTVKFRVQIKST